MHHFLLLLHFFFLFVDSVIFVDATRVTFSDYMLLFIRIFFSSARTMMKRAREREWEYFMCFIQSEIRWIFEYIFFRVRGMSGIFESTANIENGMENELGRECARECERERERFYFLNIITYSTVSASKYARCVCLCVSVSFVDIRDKWCAWHSKCSIKSIYMHRIHKSLFGKS